MNWFDVVLIAAVLVSIVSGLGKGFGRSAVGFLAFATAIVCGLWFYAPLGFWLRPYIRSYPAANGTGFLLVFAGIMILGGIAERNTARFFREADLKWADHLLGAFFGVLQGLVTATVIVLMTMAFASRPMPRAMVESRLAPCLTDAAHLMAAAAPDEVKEGFQRARRDLDRILPNPLKRGVEQLSSSTI